MNREGMAALLFVVSSSTSYRLQRLLVQHCVDKKHDVALVYDGPEDDLYQTVQADARHWKAPVAALDTLTVPETRPQLNFWAMHSPFRTWLFSLIAPWDRFIHRRILGARLAAAQQLLTQWKPKAVLVSEDGISGPASIITAAKCFNIPVFDLPYGYGTQHDLDNSLDEKALKEELIRPQGWVGKMVRIFAPMWVKKGRHCGVLMFPEDYIASREALGMTLRNAWIVHGGLADRLLVESEQMMALYRSEGIPEEKLLLTGTPYCDVMAKALHGDDQARAAFRKPQLIQPGEMRLLVSWPTSYHASRAEHCEFATYEEMTKVVLGWLHALPGCRLLVSLHPAVPGQLREMLTAMGLNISSDYVIELIPRNDVYISYFSSTQRWAIACGKPVVNYDAYGVGLGVYDAAPGFFGTHTFEEFKAAMLQLIDIEKGFKRAASDQIKVAEKWGKVDGKAMDMILTALS